MWNVCRVFLLIILSTSLYADGGFNFPNHKKGFWITPVDTPNNFIPLKSGDTKTIELNVCVKKWGEFNKKERCQKVPDSKLNFRAFFPDKMHEVTDQVQIIKSKDKKSWTIIYQTKELNANDLNQFTFVIGSVKSSAESLMKTQAKFDKRIVELAKLKEKFASREHKEKYITYIDKMIALLTDVNRRIDLALEATPDVLAEISLPLQVDNNLSAPFYYASNFSGQKMALKLTHGSAIEGESVKLDASVTNLSHLDFKFPILENEEREDGEDDERDGNNNYSYVISFNGQKIIDVSESNLYFGETWSESKIISKLNPNLDNDLSFTISKTHHFFKHKYQRKWGSLYTQIPIAPDDLAPQFSSIIPDESIQYAQHFPVISATIADEFGRIDPASLKLLASAQLFDGSSQNIDLTNKLNLTKLFDGQSYQINSDVNPLAEGVWNLTLKGSDFAENSAPDIIRSIQIDRTVPIIQLGTTDNQLTNIPEFIIPIAITDHSPVSVHILHNGQLIYNGADKIFDFNVTLVEGINTFEVHAVDAAGNMAVAQKLNNIELDTIAPELQYFSPNNNAILNLLSFDAVGTSNEPLSVASINSINVSQLTNNGKDFKLAMTAPAEGRFNLSIALTDLAGNTATFERSVDIILKVLNGDLISIVPLDNGKLQVLGVAHASRPGVLISISAGFFNQQEIYSSAEGSFAVDLDFFNHVTLIATDDNIGRTDRVDLEYNVDTTLSGIVLDNEKKPLSGVRVSIASSNQTAMTDGTGAFRIENPATGDQTLIIDGTVIPVEITGPNKKYSKTSVSVSLGTRQANILDRPIYLTPLMYDGTETQVAENESVDITSPHAPGVILKVPAGMALFPDGSKSGLINMMEIPSEVTAIPPLEFANPDTVVALEPSGLKFTEPVELTLPNVNEFPAGMQVVIMSKDSLKGIWTIDGIARVAANGTDIVTEPGQGITHFSEVYAAPLGPTVLPYGDAARAGANTFDGTLSTGIEIPTFKSLGQNVGAGLVYKSSWASPNVVISSIFDVPKQEFSFSGSAGARSLFGSGSVDVQGRAWIEPDYLDATFTSETISSQKMRFSGIPNKSLISFGMDLSLLPSGVSPYIAHFDMKLKQMIVGTRTIHEKKRFKGATTRQEHFAETRAIEQVFPSDLFGSFVIQNKSSSNVGAGWDNNLNSRILNPSKPRMSIQESDGSANIYNVEDAIESVYSTSKTLKSISLNNYPNLYTVEENSIIEYNLQSRNVDQTISAPDYSAFYDTRYRSMWYALCFDSNCDTSHNGPKCATRRYRFDVPQKINRVYKKNGELFTLDGSGLVRKYDSTYNYSTIAGKELFINDLMVDDVYYDKVGPEGDLRFLFAIYCISGEYPGYSGYPIVDNSCTGKVKCTQLGCQNDFILSENATPFGSGLKGYSDTFNHSSTVPVLEQPSKCSTPTSSNSYIPVKGFLDGATSAFNSPTDLILDDTDSVFVADYGNNRVRKVSLSSSITTTFAGNGQTFDNGDGGLAINASIFHPRGLAKDNQGNLYISTERGYIRKIDPNGFISRFAGRESADGGVFSDSAPAENMLFNQPYGMVVDNDNGYLYVADTGHHRIVRIDFETKTATVVAGSGECVSGNQIGDGKTALEASLCHPESVGLDDQNNLLIGDNGHSRVRKVTFGASNGSRLTYLPSNKDNSKLVRLEDGSFERTFRDGTIFYYNSKGLQTKALARNGREINYFYDDSDRLVSQVDPVGQEITYQYSGDKLFSISDPTGRATRFFYDGNLLTQVQFPDGSTRSFTYNSNGLLVAETNQRGISTQYEYNEWNRLSKVIRPDSSILEVSDTQSKTVGNLFVGGNIGQLKSLNDADMYDGIKDAKGSETKFNSDETGFVTSITDANNQVTTIERDLDGRPLKITRPDNTFTTFEYDQTFFDLVKKYDSFSGITEEFNYNQEGSLLSQSDNRGTLISNSYDPTTGNLLSSTNILNQVSSSTYNSLSLVSSQTNSLGQTVQREFDSLGNTIKVIASDLSETVLERDLAGNVIKRINAKGQITLNEFDVMNRLISVTNPKGDKTRYEYLPTGELSKIIYPNLAEVIFEYNSMGRLTKKIDATGMITQLIYDSNGNLVQEIDPSGNIKVFEYNNLDQLVKKLLPDDVYEYSYNVRGELIQAKNLVSQVDLEYVLTHKGSQVASAFTQGLGAHSDLPAVELNYSFDSYGNKILTETPFGDFSYQYDIANRLRILTNALNEEYSFNFDHGNRLTEITRPGSTSVFALDNTNFLTSIIHKNSNTSGEIAKFIYQKDPIGNRTQMKTLAGDHDYSYDSNNQLTSASHPEITSESFSYDDLGNRTQDQDQSYFYDARKQRLVEDALYLYWYDSRGNLSSKQAKDNSSVVNYIHNTQNQLIQIDFFEGTNKIKEARYLYDVLGRRVKKQVTDLTYPSKSFTRHYTFDGNELLAELDQDNQLLALYTQSTIRTDDTLAVHVTSVGATQGLALASGNYQFIKDGLGSVTEVTNSNGDLLQRYVYSSFGSLAKITDANGLDISQNPTLTPYYAFANRELDLESNLYYLRARYFDSSIGRFIQRDPDPGKMMNPLSLINSYIYTENNPINFTDPLGEFKFRNFVALYVTAVVTASIGFGIGLALGPVSGAFLGGSIGYMIGGEISYRTNRILGGSKEESRQLRKSGKIIGALAGTIGGIAGGIVGGGADRGPASEGTSSEAGGDAAEKGIFDNFDTCVGATVGLGTLGISGGASMLYYGAGLLIPGFGLALLGGGALLATLGTMQCPAGG